VITNSETESVKIEIEIRDLLHSNVTYMCVCYVIVSSVMKFFVNFMLSVFLAAH
jgi:hypothetical protein